MRCTFLAVGHGGCTVLETPDGRVLLYDAVAINGPDVTRRQIAPFLWNRGIRRIDEVFISHADLDHFNGLVALIDRFAVGRVTCTPTFEEWHSRPVRATLKALKKKGISVRIVKAGDRLSAGAVRLDVLHPMRVGPSGKENLRSMVLVVRHGKHSILLTGDLEGSGMEEVLALPLPRVDVLMAPHHGSRSARTPELAAKVKPQIVVSCQGPPRGATRPFDHEKILGIKFFWGTWPEGSITVQSMPTRLMVETFSTKQRILLRTRD